MVLNELYNKIIDLDLSEYTHQKLYDLCFELDDEIERLNNIINEINNAFEDKNIHNNMELVRKIKNILKGVDKE